MLLKTEHLKGKSQQVLTEIFLQNNITRLELSARLGLSQLTISKIVTNLLELGLIIEGDVQKSTGGRKPTSLMINPDYAYIIALDIGSYAFKIGVVSLDGKVMDRTSTVTYEGYIPSPSLRLDEIYKLIQTYIDQYPQSKILGISIAVSGIIDYEKQEIVFCPNIRGMDKNDIVTHLSARFNLPVFLDTSARCLALAEQYFGHGRDIQNQIFISIGYGISSGLIIHSQLFRGTNGFSGEIGHIQVSDSPDLCTCGNKGCLELYATIPMIIKQINSQIFKYNIFSPLLDLCPTPEQVTFPDIASAYRLGDKTVCKVITHIASILGKSLACSVNLLNPQLIVLGGGLVYTLPEIVEDVERFIHQNSLTPSNQQLSITQSKLDNDAPILGSACQIICRFFDLLLA